MKSCILNMIWNQMGICLCIVFIELNNVKVLNLLNSFILSDSDYTKQLCQIDPLSFERFYNFKSIRLKKDFRREGKYILFSLSIFLENVIWKLRLGGEIGNEKASPINQIAFKCRFCFESWWLFYALINFTCMRRRYNVLHDIVWHIKSPFSSPPPPFLTTKLH